ncbi:hypothetical protein HASA104033_07520 [Halobacterium salinarum]
MRAYSHTSTVASFSPPNASTMGNDMNVNTNVNSALAAIAGTNCGTTTSRNARSGLAPSDRAVSTALASTVSHAEATMRVTSGAL